MQNLINLSKERQRTEDRLDWRGKADLTVYENAEVVGR